MKIKKLKMSTQTLEPIIESSLLYTKPDGSQDFVHDSYKDFFLARWFANRINDGRLSVEDAYRNYWSYEEDAELWDLPKDREWRALLPSWKRVLMHMAGMLDDDKAEELINITEESYIRTEGLFEKRYRNKKLHYNPFFGELLFIGDLAKKSDRLSSISTIVDYLMNQLNDGTIQDEYEALVFLKRVQTKRTKEFLKYYEDVICHQKGIYPAVLSEKDEEEKTKERTAIFWELESCSNDGLTDEKLKKFLEYFQGNIMEIPIQLRKMLKGNLIMTSFVIKEYTKQYYSFWPFEQKGMETINSISDNDVASYLLDKFRKEGGYYEPGAICAMRCLDGVQIMIDYTSDPKNPHIPFVINALSRSGDPRAKKAVEDFYKRLSYTDLFNMDPDGITFAMINLIDIRSPIAIDMLLEIAKNYTITNDLLIYKIENIECGEEDLDKLIEFSRRRGRKPKSEASGPFDINYYSDPEYYSRWVTIVTLGKLKAKKAVDALMEIARDKGDIYQQQAAWALGEIRDERAVETLCWYLNDKDNPDRYKAARSLSYIKDKRAIPYLVKALNDKSNELDVRVFSAEALCELGETGIVDEVLDLFLSIRPNEYYSYKGERSYRGRLAEALSKITNQKHIKRLLKYVPKEGVDVAIGITHYNLKPQGYNPSVKKLSA